MSLTGGEPFVHPRILDILQLFPKYGVDEVSTITNGSLPLAKYQQALEYIDNLINECIPKKKYSHEWNGELLYKKILEVFAINLPISQWMEEEGVDEEEIKNRITDQIHKKYNDKKNNY